jgi:hypothetical protein
VSRTERRSRRSLESCVRSRWMISIRLDGELSEWHTAWLAAHLRHCAACATYAAALCDLVDLIRSSPPEQSDTAISAPRRSAHFADAGEPEPTGNHCAMSHSATGSHERSEPAVNESLRTNADDRLSFDPVRRVEGRDRIVEGRDVADVRPQSSVPHPLDNLT